LTDMGNLGQSGCKMSMLSRFIWLPWLLLLVFSAGCNQVPERLWDAVIEYCRHIRDCNPASFDRAYSSLDNCADKKTQRVDWSTKSDACIDAETAFWKCDVPETCTSSKNCAEEHNISLYLCQRVDTATCGYQCETDRTRCSSTYISCGWSGPRVSSVRCTTATPGFCTCRTTTCNVGEYCCYCADCP